MLKRGVSREDARQGWEVRSLFLFFFSVFDGGWSGGAERRFTPETSLPALGNKRGFFSEEHSDVGGGCECGPCVRAAAAAFVCFPSPTLEPVQTSTMTPSLPFGFAPQLRLFDTTACCKNACHSLKV